MKANRNAFKVVEIIVKKVKWAWIKIMKEKEDDFPYYRGNTFPHPPPLG